MSDRWHLHLRTLRSDLRANLARVGVLRAVARRRDEIEELLADLDRQIARADRAAVLTLVGATGAGKSALLNALVGSPIAIEGIDRPTTRLPVIYAPRDADLSELLQSFAASDPPAIVRYQVGASASAAYVLIDAPDLNSVETTHREQVRALAERSDVLVVVLHRQSVIEEAPVSFLDRFARRRGLIFVLNRTDELSPAARDVLLSQIRDLADNRWQAADAPVIAISARLTQLQPQAALELLQRLDEVARGSELARVRRKNAVGTAALLAELFARARGEVSEDLLKIPGELGAGLAALSSRIGEESTSRWELRRAALSRQLWGEAAARWDGPGGWALRAGGIGAVGLGAGALLATRHPLLAASAAAGSLAADQADRLLDRQRIAAADGLLPASGEFIEWDRDALSPARIRAARLTGDVAGLAMPPPDSVFAAASAAVGDAWQTLLLRDLPSAAEKSVLRFLRIPLDLPVYALAAVVLYRVVSGFYSGQYVGLDFLINAALLAGAYLFVVSFTVRRALARRGRALLSGAIRRTQATLAVSFDEARKRVSAESAEITATLNELCELESEWRGDG